MPTIYGREIHCNEEIHGVLTADDNFHFYDFPKDDIFTTYSVSTCNSEFDTILYSTHFHGINGFWPQNDDTFQCMDYRNSLIERISWYDWDELVIGITGFEGDYGNYSLKVTCPTTSSKMVTGEYSQCMYYIRCMIPNELRYEYIYTVYVSKYGIDSHSCGNITNPCMLMLRL